MMKLIDKIRRKWVKIRLRPIRVFCFHQISEVFDDNVYCKPDWIPLSFLKDRIGAMQREGYEFISLESAYQHIKKDRIRRKRYAVLTADDGLLCQLGLLPYLEKENIPLTLFVNLKNLDGVTCGTPVKKYFHITESEGERDHAIKLYFRDEDLASVHSSLLTIGMHGVEHEDVSGLSAEVFENQLQQCIHILGEHPCYIPFYAYTYGRYSSITNRVLSQNGIIPVMADGEMNYDDCSQIHREILEFLYQRK